MSTTGAPDVPGLARVLRLAQRITGSQRAGAALVGLGAAAVPGSGPALTLGHPLVRATLATGGVHQRQDPAGLDDPTLRSYAGTRLRTPGGTVLGALWVGADEPRELDEETCAALGDLAALLESELERSGAMGLAAQVQRQLLPAHAPSAPGYDMAAACRPALEVGGDFYDWWRTDDTMRLVVADVMGKGTPAAIVAAAVRAMLHAALTFHEPGAALNRVAGDLQVDLDHVARFATCFAAYLDLPTGRLDWADAGHGLAVVLRTDGGTTQLSSEDLPLGTLPGSTWRAQHTVLAPGDTLLTVSDGVLDLFPTAADGVARALELHAGGATANDYVADLVGMDTLGEPADDLTVVAIRRLP